MRLFSHIQSMGFLLMRLTYLKTNERHAYQNIIFAKLLPWGKFRDTLRFYDTYVVTLPVNVKL